MITSIKWIMVLVLIVLALFSDIKEKKIKNYLTYPLIILGLSINFFERGIMGLYDSFLGVIIPVILLFILYILRMFGAGDIKLFSAIGAVMGYSFVIECMLFSFLAGGIIAILVMLLRKNSLKRLKYFFEYVKSVLLTGKIEVYEKQFDNRSGKFRFAYAIFVGVLFQIGKLI